VTGVEEVEGGGQGRVEMGKVLEEAFQWSRHSSCLYCTAYSPFLYIRVSVLLQTRRNQIFVQHVHTSIE
jgi:hypothetical protein